MEDFKFGSEIASKLINDLVADINKQKEAVIEKRLADLGQLESVKSKKDYRFKPMVCEIMGNKETWWLNDGSKEGLRIVTFVTEEPEYNFEGTINKITTDISYH